MPENPIQACRRGPHRKRPGILPTQSATSRGALQRSRRRVDFDQRCLGVITVYGLASALLVEAGAHIAGDQIEQRQRRQTENQLDRLQHALVRVERRIHRAAPHIRADRQRHRAMPVHVIDAVSGRRPPPRRSPSSSRTGCASIHPRSGRARNRCRRPSPWTARSGRRSVGMIAWQLDDGQAGHFAGSLQRFRSSRRCARESRRVSTSSTPGSSWPTRH